MIHDRRVDAGYVGVQRVLDFAYERVYVARAALYDQLDATIG